MKSDDLERGNHRGLKLTNQILKTAERVIQENGKVEQQVDIKEMQFGFTLGCGATNTILVFRQLQKKY